MRAHGKGGDELVVLVRFACTPNARETAVAARLVQDDSTEAPCCAIGVRLAAPPRDGAANAELLRLASSLLGVPKGAVALHAGGSARAKVVRVAAAKVGGAAGACARLAAKLGAVLDQPPS